MSIIKGYGSGDATGGFYTKTLANSLRFNEGPNANTTDSSYLTRAAVTPTNAYKWPLSVWIKRSVLHTEGSSAGIISSDAEQETLSFGLDSLTYRHQTGGGLRINLITNNSFRDTSNWYHIVCAVDHSLLTTDDKAIIYVNGVRQTLSTNTIASATYNSQLLTAGNTINIGKMRVGSHFTGYMSEMHFVDGQQLTPTTFGETKQGVWIPKAVSGLTYGNNGFYLNFGNSSAIGEDSAGSNDYTAYNLNSWDIVPDSPTNNFATALGSLSEPQDYQSYYKGTYSEGNLKVTGSSSGCTNGQSNFGMTSGKWYAECIVNSWTSSSAVRIGLRARPARTYDEYFVLGNGTGQLDAAARNGRLASFSTGDVIQFALDLENNAFYLGVNGTWGNSATATEIANGTTTNAFASGSEVPTGDGHAYFFYAQPHSTGTSLTWNFGQDSSFAGAKTAQGNSDSGSSTTDFYYTPPDGFLACNTTNIPELTISPAQDTQADDHFNTVLYDANNQTAQSITGVGFQPDWMWFKQRSRGDSHAWIDTVRGIDKAFRLPVIDDEFDNSNSATLVTAVGADGFTLGTDAFAWVNYQSDTMVAWNWKAGGDITDVSGNFIKDGVAFTPTQGTIDATAISANTTSGFSIVTYTGSGSAGTVAHGLSVAPSMVIIKSRTGASVKNWVIGQDQSGFTGQMYFDTGVFSSNSGSFNNTAPTTSVVSIGTDQTTNGSGATYAMYCFANVEGYSKIGQYSGNSSSDGTFVYLGFRPAFLMIKTTSVSSQYWILRDNKRDAFNDDSNGSSLYANTQDSEGTGNIDIDFLSNGMKMRDNGNNTNGSGTYIYLAFAEQPFKFSNAR